LKHFFEDNGRCFSVRPSGRYSSAEFSDPKDAIESLKRQTWGALAARLELRKILSLKRITELDRQIETGEGLPEINAANVLAMLETNLNQRGQFLQEKVLEVYEKLRPARSDLKTNIKSCAAGVGKKVILTWYAVDSRYDGGFKVNYNRQDELRALDQVFHLLDGATQPDDYNGELSNAIQLQTSSTNNAFETPYFQGRCFRNGRLHLTFRRDDLLAKFNLIAGGNRLT